ncbi:MAG TPA: HEAT repeat domain-containing protein [Methanomicrobiales archaeon]|nr:HEAT repeat domain-containing protein [Methanomicrobiales archaeon]
MALRDEKFTIPEELIIEDLAGQDRKIRQNALDLLNVMTWYDWDPAKFIAAGGAQALITCLEDPDEEARRLAAFLIGYVAEACGVENTGVAGAVPLLMKLFDGSTVSLSRKILSRGSRNLRVAAGNTLVKIGTPAVEALTVALHNPNKDVRFNAARALGEIRDVRAVEPLLDLLRDQNRTVRLASARSLGFIRDARAVEPLCHALGDRARMVRNYVAWALGEIGDERAVPYLQKAYKHALMEGDLSGQFAINAALEDIESAKYRKYRE